jgi:tRNA threonylcarbamoyl adenosine modification protein YeaZ
MSGARGPDRPPPTEGLSLAIDTATRTTIVAVGGVASQAVVRAEAGRPRGADIIELIEEALAGARAPIGDIAALIVGTGPGSFTGLRIGLATAKTLAYVRRLPLVGVPTTDALRHAVAMAGASPETAIVLPAGARDQYLARAGEDPVLVAPGDLRDAVGDAPVAAVDLDASVLGREAVRLGETALERLPAALLELGRQRLATATLEDAALLVPAYVALPRGVRQGPEELGWSPDLR